MIRRIIFLVGLIVIVGFAWFYFVNRNSDAYKLPKPEPLSVSQHSEDFHNSLKKMMVEYYAMSEAFVNWDTGAIHQKSEHFLSELDQLKMKNLQNDSLIFKTAVIYQDKARQMMGKMINASSLSEKRTALNLLTPALYDFLRVVKYDHDKVYLMECPMAFNDEESGFWLSPINEVRNPYLGTSHPKYKKGMLKCGMAKDTLNFTSHFTGTY